jgi:hypothetical protein
MSVQWWVGDKRVSFGEAMEARARGKCPSATVDATDGWPEIGWPEIVAHVENDGHVAIEAMDLQIFRLPGMFRADALLRDIDAGRRKSEEEKGQHARRQQGEPAPVIETDGHAFTCLCGVSLHVPAKSRDMAKVEAEMRGWRCTRDNEMAIVWRCPSCATPSRDSTPDYYRIPRDAVQLWDAITALGLTHCHASALEYVYRAGRKPGVAKVHDLRKAVANLEYEIARLEEEPIP